MKAVDNISVESCSLKRFEARKEIRIFGPPGCGKTTTLSRLVHAACQEFGSDGVMVCSFTKTAARVLVSRNLPLDPLRVGTLHAICYRLLGHPKLLADRASLEGWNAAYPMYLMAGGVSGLSSLDDPYSTLDAKGEGEGDSFLQELNRLRGLLMPPDLWRESLQGFADTWRQYKGLTGQLDFTDLIEMCLQQEVPLPDGTRALFLDEVQDFSPLELTLARMWGASCEVLYIAGDDDQTLYRFKGATPHAFLSPSLPAEQIFVLDQSYRVPRAVHRVACEISAKITTRHPKTYHPRQAEGVVDALPDVTYRYPLHLKDHLLEWMKAGQTIALLASCSYMLDPLKKELRDWGIPYHNPYRRTRGDWNPLIGRQGSMSAAQRVLNFLKPSRSHGFWTYPELWSWVSELDAKSIFAHGAKTEIRRHAEREELQATIVDEAQLQEWIPDPSVPMAVQKGDLDWYVERLLKSSLRPVSYACQIVKGHGAEALEKPPQVILGTIHSVKGGEVSIVVLFPDLSNRGYEEYASDNPDAVDAVHRMFYVGVTRAKEALYLAGPSHEYLYYPLDTCL